MVKIKQKKTMNLPQLIEHIWANNLRHKWKDSDNTSAYVQVYDDGQLVVDKCTKDSVFTVEVEEVVDSDTVLDNIYTVNVEVGTSHTTYYKSKSINDVKTDEINIVYTILQEEAIVLWDSQGGFR